MNLLTKIRESLADLRERLEQADAQGQIVAGNDNIIEMQKSLQGTSPSDLSYAKIIQKREQENKQMMDQYAQYTLLEKWSFRQGYQVVRNLEFRTYTRI